MSRKRSNANMSKKKKDSNKRVSFGVPHMEWNAKRDRFEPTRPEPSPVVKVKVSVMKDVHQKFGVKVGEISRTRMIDAVADTGCQTTTCGVEILHWLNIDRNGLIPTSHGMQAIENSSLNVIGSVFAKLTLRGKTTRQMIHVSDKIDGMFLSERACKDLGIVTRDFPDVETIVAATKTKMMEEKCSCFERENAPEKPTQIPYLPTEANKKKLKDWLISRFKSSAFNTCKHQPLNKMTGAPMKINFKEGAVPYASHTPIPVPIFWKEQIKEGLDADVRLKIIEEVPQGTPVTWLARMVPQGKKNGGVRRTVDLQKLKEATLRETHHTPTPFDIVSTVPPDKYKTVLDAWNGYHSLPLAEESKDATSFITEWGRYRYLRAPQGFHASGDAYTRRFDDITSSFERVSRCIDDSILWDDSIEECFWHAYEYLKHCSDNGIVFNVEKFVFAEKTCEFAGFELTPSGYRPPKRILDAILGFPVPKTPTDVKSWFGLVNQVAYAFAQSGPMAPFRDLLSKKKKDWSWTQELTEIFENSKQKIVDLIKEGVCTFRKDLVTCIATDWSRTGIGFSLCQKHCTCPKNVITGTWSPNCGNGHWKLVMAGSRFTKPAESRYSSVEGEALAVTYALNQCKKFVIGCPNLVVAVDNQALVKILNDRSLDTIQNPRLLRMKEKTLPYDFKIVYIPGVSNLTPDFGSRHPTRLNAVTVQGDADEDVTSEEEIIMSSIAATVRPVDAVSWEDVNAEAALDDESVRLKNVITSGFPDRRDELPEDLRYFYPFRDELYVIDNTVFKEKKMLIPKKLRVQIVEALHAAHQGVSSMKANARDRFFWPHLDADIKNVRSQCKLCNEIAPSQANEQMIVTPSPNLPFEQVVMDLFYVGGHQYLVYADRYTGWTEVEKVTTSNAQSIVGHLRKWFKTFGCPKEVSSDGGPPFNSIEYRNFLRTWQVEPRMSSAHYAQSNGRAEAAVKVMKRTLMGCLDKRTGEMNNDAAAKAVMTHRNTPSQTNNMSPAEMLFGYKIADHLPNEFRSVRRSWKEVLRNKEYEGRGLEQAETPKRKSLEPLLLGDTVSVQNQYGNKKKRWSNTGVVVDVHPHRKYSIMIDGSRIGNSSAGFHRTSENWIMGCCQQCLSYVHQSIVPQSGSSHPTR